MDYLIVGGFLLGYLVLATLTVSLIVWAMRKGSRGESKS
jgi:hypothetical protein